MVLIAEHARYAVDVVVVHEVVGIDILINTAVCELTVHGMRYFKVVVVVVA